MVYYSMYDIFFSGFTPSILLILQLICCGFAVAIPITKNPIISIIFLILLFSTVSLYLISINMYFIGISYLLVYVGAVSILFIFILMLVNIRISELLNPTRNSIPLSIITVLYLYSILNKSTNMNDNQTIGSKYYNKLKYVTSTNWETNLTSNNDISSLGNIMYNSYSIWLILTGIILLVSMIGVISITIKQ